MNGLGTTDQSRLDGGAGDHLKQWRMAMIDAFVAKRIEFCRSMVEKALKRGDEKDAAEWQELVEMWQQSAYFDEAFAKPEAEGDEDA